MKTGFSKGNSRRSGSWLALLGVLVAVFACQSQEPPLHSGTAEFKKEVKDCITTLQTHIVQPLFQKDLPALNEALKYAEPQAVKLCRMCPFRIGVLNQEGVTLVVHPPKENAIGNFSSYEVVIQALKSRRTAQQRLFLQDGSQVYIICAPIFREDQVLGLLVLAVSADEAKKRWDMTAEEFLAIDFNR